MISPVNSNNNGSVHGFHNKILYWQYFYFLAESLCYTHTMKLIYLLVKVNNYFLLCVLVHFLFWIRLLNITFVLKREFNLYQPNIYILRTKIWISNVILVQVSHLCYVDCDISFTDTDVYPQKNYICLEGYMELFSVIKN